MQRNVLTLQDRELVFYYFNDLHDVNRWRKPISFDYYKINFFLEMDATVIINDTVYAPRKYEFLSFPPYSNHYGIVEREQNIEYFEFLIPKNFFDCIDKEGAIDKMLHEITEKTTFAVPSSQQEKFTKKMYALRDMFQENTERVRIIVSLLDILYEIKQYSNNPTQIPTNALSPNLLSIIAYMEDHFATLHSIKELADAMHISRAYIAQLFKREIGCTPYEYLTDMKIEHSIKLLREGKNVTEACFEAGFNSCSVYIQVFKKKLSQTPYKYKKMIDTQ